jgi:hypothetical protein
VLAGLVDNCRDVFGFGHNNLIIFSDMRDAYRVLVGAARLALRHSGTQVTTPRPSLAVAAAKASS